MLSGQVARLHITRKGNDTILTIRVLLCVIALVMLLLNNWRAGGYDGILDLLTRVPLLIQILIFLFLNIFYGMVIRWSNRERLFYAPFIAVMQILVDICLLGVLNLYTGGVESPLVMLMIFPVIAAGVILNAFYAYLTAGLACTVQILIALCYHYRWLPDAAVINGFHDVTNMRDVVSFILIPLTGFSICGFLAGQLNQRVVEGHFLRHELLEGLGEAIIVANQDGAVLRCNQHTSDLLGKKIDAETSTLESVLGKELAGAALQAAKDGVRRDFEFNFIRNDGSLMPLMARINPVKEEGGDSPHTLILAFEDVSLKKRFAEMERHRHRVAAMSNAAAAIAHEIRNPLASIRGAVQEISRHEGLPPDKRELAEIVLNESDRLDQIISDFLKFARMRAPQMVVTEPERLLNDARKLLEQRPDAAGIEIRVEAGPGTIRADTEQLRQIFINLGVNALEAMSTPDCGKLLKLTSFECGLGDVPGYDSGKTGGTPDRPGVLFEIEDSGPGMMPEVRRQVFDPFYTTKAGGTGLGLAVVERVVQAHEGAVFVDSEEGRGTIVRVWIPSDLKQEPPPGTTLKRVPSFGILQVPNVKGT